MNKDAPVLILGAGSIGERHIRNLWKLGYRNLYVYRQRNLPFRDISDAEVKIILDWKEAESTGAVCAFICTPSSQHMEQVIACLRNNMHVFAEKPLSHTLERMDELKKIIKQKNKYLSVAYMMRFHPHLQKIKSLTQSGQFGDLHTIDTHWGSYLPDWHPYEDYRDTYAAKKELGGGAALTLSHDLDVANWIANAQIRKYSSSFSYESDLGIDADVMADFLITYENNVQAHVHLNYIEKPPKRTYSFLFTSASIDIDYFSATMKITAAGKTSVDQITDFERNDLYIKEAEAFFDTIDKVSDYAEESLKNITESEQIITLCSDYAADNRK